MLSRLSGVGLGFQVNDAVLIPLLVLFLLVTLLGLYFGKRHHGSWTPLLVGAAGGAVTATAVLFGSGWQTGMGIAGLLNVWLRMRQLRRR